MDKTLILTILFIHFVCDFLFQTKWMAENKSKHISALTMHVLVYYLGLFMLSPVAHLPAYYAPVNAGLHFITDFFTSRVTARLWKAGNTRSFFKVIGLDQFIHAFCLIITLPSV